MIQERNSTATNRIYFRQRTKRATQPKRNRVYALRRADLGYLEDYLVNKNQEDTEILVFDKVVSFVPTEDHRSTGAIQARAFPTIRVLRPSLNSFL